MGFCLTPAGRLNDVIQICQNHPIVAGIPMAELEMLKDWIKKGMRFVTYGSDVQLLEDAALYSVSELRRRVK